MDVCFVVSLTTLIIIWHDCVFVNTFFEKILFGDFALFLIRIFVDFSVVELWGKSILSLTSALSGVEKSECFSVDRQGHSER